MPAPETNQPGGQEPGVQNTQIAQTVIARITEAAQGTALAQPLPSNTPPVLVTNTTAPVVPTNTQAPPPPTNTLAPAQPTNTQAPPPTNTVAPTPTPLPCLRASFVRDVNVPDDTVFAPGATFTKTWRLRNNGSCSWDEDFQLVFYRGDELGGPDTVDLDERVRPGETVDISVDLVAPSEVGTFRGNWMLRDDDNERFGIGEDGDKPFWVQIKVNEVTEGVVYNFVTNVCEAKWDNGDDRIPCEGDRTTDPDGSVHVLEDPDLEHRQENEPALWINLPRDEMTWVSGWYPEIKIKDGDRFRADIGCLADRPDCDVTFRIYYRVGNGDLNTLGSWRETSDGDITNLNIDLSQFAGKFVQLVLTVEAGPKTEDDDAFWLVPHIFRPGD
jgi:hypothetical protein